MSNQHPCARPHAEAERFSELAVSPLGDVQLEAPTDLDVVVKLDDTALVAGEECGFAGYLSDDAGQATTEYALVLLGVAAVALALLAWAGGTDKIGELLDAALDAVIGRVV